jgi:hypothetical protein
MTPAEFAALNMDGDWLNPYGGSMVLRFSGSSYSIVQLELDKPTGKFIDGGPFTRSSTDFEITFAPPTTPSTYTQPLIAAPLKDFFNLKDAAGYYHGPYFKIEGSPTTLEGVWCDGSSDNIQFFRSRFQGYVNGEYISGRFAINGTTLEFIPDGKNQWLPDFTISGVGTATTTLDLTSSTNPFNFPLNLTKFDPAPDFDGTWTTQFSSSNVVIEFNDTLGTYTVPDTTNFSMLGAGGTFTLSTTATGTEIEFTSPTVALPITCEYSFTATANYTGPAQVLILDIGSFMVLVK